MKNTTIAAAAKKIVMAIMAIMAATEIITMISDLVMDLRIRQFCKELHKEVQDLQIANNKIRNLAAARSYERAEEQSKSKDIYNEDYADIME